MDNTVLVSYNASPSGRSPPLASLGIKKAFPDFQTVRSSPTVSQASTSSNHPIGQTLQREIEDVLLAVWKAKAAAKYKSFIDRWKLFCIQGSDNCYKPSVLCFEVFVLLVREWLLLF